jgi:ERCC4-type nuclease
MKLASEIPAEALIAIVDSREQLPLDLSPLRVARGTLSTGDYSIRGLEHVVAIERKALEDFLCCCGAERERFEREVQRLLSYPVRALVIESSWQALERGEWRSKVTSAQAVGSALGWIACGLPIVMCYTHERAGRYVSRLLFTAARRRWREARALVAAVRETTLQDVAAADALTQETGK